MKTLLLFAFLIFGFNVSAQIDTSRRADLKVTVLSDEGQAEFNSESITGTDFYISMYQDDRFEIIEEQSNYTKIEKGEALVYTGDLTIILEPWKYPARKLFVEKGSVILEKIHFSK